MTPMNLKDKTALVTGAASGIGRGIARALAKRGCHLALADVNEAGLDETTRLVGNNVRVSRHKLDVGDRAAIAAFPATVQAAHPGVDVLVNNAGVAVGGAFEQVSEADFDWLFEINFWGVVRMTRAFLPILKGSPDAHIVNVSSLYGLIAPPGDTAYAASKFAVRGFSQSLRHELLGTNIGVTVVHPGGVATQIANSARLPAGTPDDVRISGLEKMNKLLKMPPDQAGEIIVTATERRRARVIVGNDAKVVSVLERLMPVHYWNVLAKTVGRSSP